MQLLGSTVRARIVDVHSNSISVTGNIVVGIVSAVAATVTQLNHRKLTRDGDSGELPS